MAAVIMAAVRGREIWFAIMAGLLLSLSFPPFQQAWAIVLGPLSLLLSLVGMTPRQAAWLGVVAGLAHYLTGIWWVVISTWGFGGAPFLLAVLLLGMLALYLSLFIALAAFVAAWLSRGRLSLLALCWPLAWMLGEFARDTFFHGFPWFSLGYVATDWPQGLSLAGLFGVHGVSMYFAGLSAALLLLLLAGFKARLSAGMVLIGAVGLQAWAPAPSSWTEPAGEALKAVLIQGNIPQDQKWRPENRWPTVALYQELTREAWPADLVVWPEVAIPLPYEYAEWLFEEQSVLAAEQGGTLFAGILTRQGGRNFNTVYALGEDEGRYVKSHLVPFGEYIPVPDWIKPMFDVLGLPFPRIASEGMSGRETLSVNGHQVSMSICFEDVFPLEVRATSVRSGFLVNVTNDAWFDGSAAPEQHLQIARLRAAESGRVMLRIANTGISAVIDADGEVLQRLGWGQRGHLRTELTPRQGMTPYQRFGRTPIYLAMLLLLGMLLLLRNTGASSLKQ